MEARGIKRIIHKGYLKELEILNLNFQSPRELYMFSLFGGLPFGTGIRFVLCHFKRHINSSEVKGKHILTQHIKSHFLVKSSVSGKGIVT